MHDREEILNFIENTSYIYTPYILKKLKEDFSLKIISEIIAKSGKEISEAVFVFVTAIVYIFKKGNTFSKLEEKDSFKQYVEDNYDQILKISIEKSVQGNIPERALPLLEVLNRKIKNTSIFIIELGAAYGLVGRSLLSPDKIIEKKERYFPAAQQIPPNVKGIDYYLGIELDPPEKEWLLSGLWEEDYATRLRKFIGDIQPDERFKLLEGNAFSFSKLEAVKELANRQGTIIVLTSFMLYQYDDEKKKELINEIFDFIKKVNGHWINQAVNISLDSKDNEYFITWDGEKIIELVDDSCSSWRWIK